jgi:hypothetical protein
MFGYKGGAGTTSCQTCWVMKSSMPIPLLRVVNWP